MSHRNHSNDKSGLAREEIKERVDLVDFIGRYVRLSRNGRGYTGCCPFHTDKNPSLTVDREKGLWHCFGCGAGGDGFDFLQKIENIDFKEAFQQLAKEVGVEIKPTGRGQVVHPESHSNTRTPSGYGLTLTKYSEAKAIPIDFLRELGLSDIHYAKFPAVRIPYFDTDQTDRSVRFRLSLDGENRFRWRTGSKVLPYGLWRRNHTREAGYVVLVEGESDCHTLWFHEIPALGLPGANVWREEWAEYLADIQTIYVVIEPDQGGESVKKWLSSSSIRDRVKLVRLMGAKDPSQLYLDDPGAFRARWQAAMEAATAWRDVEQVLRDEQAAKAFATAKDLLNDPQFLERVRKFMQKRGYAGDTTPPMLAYIAMTSRLLERPLNLAFVAQSATGKNRAIDAALELVPPEYVHVEKAGSERALIYSDDDFQHRVVVVAEADSIPNDGPAASAVRSIADDNCMTYDIVENDQKTGQYRTRRITKPGPTCLLTTSVKSLYHQLGTRMLEVPIQDDEAQTRAVLRAHARSVLPHKETSPDAEPFLGLQRYLQCGVERGVVVPFSEILSECIPAKPVRMRRDFLKLLMCIEAVALIHQCQREKTSDGEIIATIADYKIARNLLESIFDVISSEGLTHAARETVEAIDIGEEISEAKLAKRLCLSRSTVSYRVRRATRGGWLVNEETRRGYPARLRRGTEMPEETSVLPTPQQLQEAFETYSENSTMTLREAKAQSLPTQPSGVFDRSTCTGGDVDPPPPSDTHDTNSSQGEMRCKGCGGLVLSENVDKAGRCPECARQDIPPF